MELDNAIIDAARNGDDIAMRSLLFQVQPNVRRYAMKHCAISDIDDAVQEVLLVIATKLQSLRVLAAFSSWLFKTVQRECRRLGRVALNYDPFDEAGLENWLSKATDMELLLELNDALNKLPMDTKEIILLKDFQQLKNSEIADELGISLAAVKSRLHRSRLLLRELLIQDN